MTSYTGCLGFPHLVLFPSVHSWFVPFLRFSRRSYSYFPSRSSFRDGSGLESGSFYVIFRSSEILLTQVLPLPSYLIYCLNWNIFNMTLRQISRQSPTSFLNQSTGGKFLLETHLFFLLRSLLFYIKFCPLSQYS